jgi:hypothetical protein
LWKTFTSPLVATTLNPWGATKSRFYRKRFTGCVMRCRSSSTRMLSEAFAAFNRCRVAVWFLSMSAERRETARGFFRLGFRSQLAGCAARHKCRPSIAIHKANEYLHASTTMARCTRSSALHRCRQLHCAEARWQVRDRTVRTGQRQFLAKLLTYQTGLCDCLSRVASAGGSP